MAFYRHGTHWEASVQKAAGDFTGAMADLFKGEKLSFLNTGDDLTWEP